MFEIDIYEFNINNKYCMLSEDVYIFVTICDNLHLYDEDEVVVSIDLTVTYYLLELSSDSIINSEHSSDVRYINKSIPNS